LAQVRALSPFAKRPGGSGGESGDIPEGAWRQIKWQPATPVFPEGEPGFQIIPEHPGFLYDQAVAIRVVDGPEVRELKFSPSDFSYPDPALKASLSGAGFAGFSVTFPRSGGRAPEKTAEFLGASHFKGTARHSEPGVAARAVILNPAQPGGEEFAWFREFWIVRPPAGASELTVYALLESPSMTGAFQFVIKPGTSMIMDVAASLYRRRGADWPQVLGVLPMAGMYLYSEKENGSPYDWRPELHGVDALLFSEGQDSWSHRALTNPKRLMISVMDLQSPGGFGLAQKDNNFDHYQDIGRRWDKRTWLWAEPLAPLPEGRLEIIEIPSSREIHDNILAFWALSGPNFKGEPRVRLSYRLFWMPPASTPHSLGRVAAARMLTRTSKEFDEFYLDFEGTLLNSITLVEGLASVVQTGPENPVLEKSLMKNTVTGGWRLRFKVKPPKEAGFVDSLLGGGGGAESDQRRRVAAWLVRGDNLPQPITERFVYDYPPN
jgi:glucans biosynthesis protein